MQLHNDFYLSKYQLHILWNSKGTEVLYSEKFPFWDFPDDPVVKTSSSNAGSEDSTPGWGTNTPLVFGKKNKKHHKTETLQHYNKFNKDGKNGPCQKKSFRKKSPSYS